MARTSRNGGAPNVDALDKIDLDDMFADDGDDMFGDLGIDDLDMDFTGGDAIQAKSESSHHEASSIAAAAAAHAAAPLPAESSTRLRRTTKRKSKPPAHYEDGEDDDIYDEAPAKKKKKASPQKKSKGAKKQAQDTKATATTKSKVKTKSAPMPAPLQRGTMTAGTVAAAGQFGGRQQKIQKQRGASFTTQAKTSKLPKLPLARATTDPASKLKGRAQQLPTAAKATAASNFAQIKAAHPGLGQSQYCGLQPSNTLFYPFMPTLPVEPAMKSRKVYSAVDRIHTAFTSRLQTPQVSLAADKIVPAKATDPIFLLMQEAYKEDSKPSSSSTGTAPQPPPVDEATRRIEYVGNAVGTVRKTIAVFDKLKLAGDWHAVCALLQRQHDFLKQNAANMEQWCKNRFSDEDYAAVYLPEQPKAGTNASVLGSFGRRHLKVRIVCTGFKEQKPGLLVAVLPPMFAPAEDAGGGDKPAKPAASTKTKKRKATAAPAASARPPPGVVGQLSSMKQKQQPPPRPLSYVDMKPDRRRRNVAEMLTRTARELEHEYFGGLDVRRKAIDRQESDVRKVVDQDNMGSIHTVGMWKWLETSGYFNGLGDADIQQLLDDVRSPVPDKDNNSDENQKKRAAVPSPGVEGTGVVEESIVDRLQSLLVEVECGDDEDDDLELDFDEAYTVSDTADVSKLTLEERSFVHLHSFGLAESLALPLAKPAPLNGAPAFQCADAVNSVQAGSTPLPALSQNGVGNHDSKVPEKESSSSSTLKQDQSDEEESDIDAAIDAMTREVVEANAVTNRRVAFLESVAGSSGLAVGDLKRKNDEEVSIIAKCQQLLRRAKEAKARTGKMSKNADSLALPW